MRTLAGRLLALQLLIVALTVTLGAAVSVRTAQERTHHEQAQRVSAIADTLAQSPEVAAALRLQHPERVLQPLAERTRRGTGVDFVVVMSPQRVRYSHPNPARIGGRFVGTVAPALAGRTFTETYTGTLGRSVRAVAPVRQGRRVIGLVSVGVLQQKVSSQIARQLPTLLALAAAALALGVALSLLVARRVKRQTLGLEPREIAGLYEHRQAVLHAIREGVLVTGADGRLVLANDEARRLLALPDAPEGRPVAELLGPGTLAGAIAAGETLRDDIHLAGERVLVVNQSAGEETGTVTTLRDRTELEALVRELDAVRTLADSLRAQAHESANKLHTLVGLVELERYEEAVRFGTEQGARVEDVLARLQERVEEPSLVALLVGKAAEARERGVTLELTEDSRFAAGLVAPTDLVTVAGNLIDNAVDAVADHGPEPYVWLRLHSAAGEAVIEVRDNGPGVAADPPDAVFAPGWSTKASDRPGGRGLGLALVRQTAERLGGSATVSNDGGAVFVVRLPAPVGVPR